MSPLPGAPDAWDRMWSIYHAAGEQPAARRPDFVRAAAAGDPDLAQQVMTLLAARQAAGDHFLEPPRRMRLDIAAAPKRSLTGTRIGRFLVGERIGRGGDAEVYVAQQFDPPRSVAIKVINGDPVTAPRDGALAAEAAILARLAHPGIAAVHEAGTIETGDGPHAWIAMELVRGVPLTTYAARAGLDSRARAALLADVCRAVHHAHLRGIVHLDLKPSNILVADGDAGEAPRIRVLDFGIARIIGAGDACAEGDAVRRVGGTLPYMSPEQLTGDPGAIDARTDVYALGVLGYELLSGRLPLRFPSASLIEARRLLREQAPTPLGIHGRALRGDAESIVAKAMAKAPEHRYASASELAADLDRWRRREPVLARPAPRRRRILRFVQREPLLSLVLASAVATLLIGAGLSLWQAGVARAAERHAITRAEDMRRLAMAVIDDLQNALKALPGGTQLRASLIATTTQFLDSAGLHDSEDPELLRVIAEAHLRLGQIMGAPRSASLNDSAKAVEQYDRARSLYERAAARDPSRAAALHGLAETWQLLADAHQAAGRYDEAIAAALASADAWARAADGHDLWAIGTSVGLNRFAGAIAGSADRPDIIEKALARSSALVRALPPHAGGRDGVAALDRVRLLAEYARQLAEAGGPGAAGWLGQAEALARSVDHRTRLPRRAGAWIQGPADALIDVLRTKADLRLGAGAAIEAATAAAECIDLCRARLAGASDPDGPAVGWILSDAHRIHMHALERSGRIGEALESGRAGIDAMEAVLALDPSAVAYRYRVVIAVLARLALLITVLEHPPSEVSDGRLRQWLADAEAALARVESLTADGHDVPAPSPARADDVRARLAAAATRLAVIRRHHASVPAGGVAGDRP